MAVCFCWRSVSLTGVVVQRSYTLSLYELVFLTVGQICSKRGCSKRQGAEAVSLLKGFEKTALFTLFNFFAQRSFRVCPDITGGRELNSIS